MGFATHILVAYDFSDRAGLALDNGCQLASRFGAKLSVLHVRDRSVPIANDGGERLKTREEVDAAFEERLRSACAERLANIPDAHTEVIVAGAVADTLCKYAAAQGVDLIVAGNQGVSGIVRMLMGSVAEEIVRHAPCPVLIVRTKTD